MSKTTKRALGIGLLLGLVGLLMVVPVFAQGNTPPAPTPGFGGRGFGLGPGLGKSWAVFDAAAQALGLTPEQLFSELHSGKTLEEIAQARNVDIQKVYDAMKAAHIQEMKAAIQQAVQDGRITQEQADWLLEGLDKGYIPMGGRGFGFGRGFGGPCPRRGTTPSTPSPSPTPSSSSTF